MHAAYVCSQRQLAVQLAASARLVAVTWVRRAGELKVRLFHAYPALCNRRLGLASFLLYME
jgi:hypothetical protein